MVPFLALSTNEHAASLPAQALLVAQRVKISARDVGDLGSIPGLGRFPWRREWLLTLVFMPGESHGQRSLVGYSRTRPSDPYFILPLAPNSMLAGMPRGWQEGAEELAVVPMEPVVWDLGQAESQTLQALGGCC